jgi:hypothetical protein
MAQTPTEKYMVQTSEHKDATIIGEMHKGTSEVKPIQSVFTSVVDPDQEDTQKISFLYPDPCHFIKDKKLNFLNRSL